MSTEPAYEDLIEIRKENERLKKELSDLRKENEELLDAYMKKDAVLDELAHSKRRGFMHAFRK